jgi:hypothetical protein
MRRSPPPARASSSATPTTSGCAPAPRWCARSGACTVHPLAAGDAHRQRRLPGVLARGAAQHRRRRGHVPLAPRRQRAAPHARGERAHADAARRDIAMAFDECPPGDADRDAIEAAMARTTAWAARCLARRARRSGALRHRAGRHHEDLRLVTSRTSRRRCPSTASRSAGSPWASRGRTCTARSTPSRTACPTSARATSWASGRPATSSGLARGHRHVRLRAPHAQRAQRAVPHLERPREHQAGAPPLDDGPRSTRAATGPAATASTGAYTRGYLRHLYVCGRDARVRG